MTSTSLPTASRSKLGCGLRGLRSAARPARLALARQGGGGGGGAAQASTALTEVPSPEKRTVMNLLLLGAVGLPVAGLAGPFALYFVPKRWDILQQQQLVVAGLICAHRRCKDAVLRAIDATARRGFLALRLAGA